MELKINDFIKIFRTNKLGPKKQKLLLFLRYTHTDTYLTCIQRLSTDLTVVWGGEIGTNSLSRKALQPQDNDIQQDLVTLMPIFYLQQDYKILISLWFLSLMR